MSTRRPASKLPTPVPEDHVSNGQRNSVVLGPKDRLVGQLFIEGDLRVAGTVEGVLEATGDIEIAGGGKVNGQVTAYNRLVVGSDASLIASEVRAARLTVQDGARFSGRVSMGPGAVEPLPAAPTPEPVPEPQPVVEAPPPIVASTPARVKTVQQKGKRR